MRIDLLLKSLCLVKTRSQGRRGCETGRIKLNGRVTKPSREAREGDILEITYPHRVLVVELLEIPSGQVPKKDCSGFMRIIREAPINGDSGGWYA